MTQRVHFFILWTVWTQCFASPDKPPGTSVSLGRTETFLVLRVLRKKTIRLKKEKNESTSQGNSVFESDCIHNTTMLPTLSLVWDNNVNNNKPCGSPITLRVSYNTKVTLGFLGRWFYPDRSARSGHAQRKVCVTREAGHPGALFLRARAAGARKM